MCVCVGGVVPSHSYNPPPKLKALTFFLIEDMAHYVFSHKTIYVFIAISMQPHTYVHITHDMSMHKSECPMAVVTLVYMGVGGGLNSFVLDPPPVIVYMGVGEGV